MQLRIHMFKMFRETHYLQVIYFLHFSNSSLDSDMSDPLIGIIVLRLIKPALGMI